MIALIGVRQIIKSLKCYFGNVWLDKVDNFPKRKVLPNGCDDFDSILWGFGVFGILFCRKRDDFAI